MISYQEKPESCAPRSRWHDCAVNQSRFTFSLLRVVHYNTGRRRLSHITFCWRFAATCPWCGVLVLIGFCARALNEHRARNLSQFSLASPPTCLVCHRGEQNAVRRASRTLTNIYFSVPITTGSATNPCAGLRSRAAMNRVVEISSHPPGEK